MQASLLVRISLTDQPDWGSRTNGNVKKDDATAALLEIFDASKIRPELTHWRKLTAHPHDTDSKGTAKTVASDMSVHEL